MTGLELIAQERARQIEVEGWTAEHDAQHTLTDLIQASACYAATPSCNDAPVPDLWPWHDSWWKPSPDNRVRELEKAGALALAAVDRIAAEIDRLQAEKDGA